MHAVEIHATGEQLGGSGQAEGRQIPAVRTAPQANVILIHVGPRAQVEAGALDIVKLARPAGPVVGRLAKVQPIADAAAVVNR